MGAAMGTAGGQKLALVSLSAEERGAFKSGAVVDVGASDATLDVRFGRDCALFNFAVDASPDPAGSLGPVAAQMLGEVTTKRWVAMVLRQCDMAAMQGLASGAPPSMDMKLREKAGAGERELGTLTELVFWKTGGALVFTGAGQTHVARFATGGDSFMAQGVSVTNETTVPDSLMQMAEAMSVSLSVVGPLEAGVSLPRTSDGGLVVKGGRTIRESAVREPRVVVDRNGSFLMYAPAEGGMPLSSAPSSAPSAVTQWWFWLLIVLAGLVVVGAVLFMRTSRGRAIRGFRKQK
jgi:hypothetical protein